MSDHTKEIIDKAIEAVFDSDALDCADRGWNRDDNTDVAVVGCGNSVINVRKLVTVALASWSASKMTLKTAAELKVTPIADALAEGRKAYHEHGSVIDDNPYETLDRQFLAWMVGWELERESDGAH
jgi:hypothetical protein